MFYDRFGHPIDRRTLLGLTGKTLAGGAVLGFGLNPELARLVDAATRQDAGRVSGQITVWAYADPIIVNSIKAILPAFYRQYPGVKVSLVPVADANMTTKLLAAIASGQGIPDVAHIGVWDALNFVQQGALRDMTPQLKPYMHDILPYQIAAWQQDAKMYGVPWGGTAASVFYRRDVFAQVGIQPSQIKTWDDFIKAGRRVVAATHGRVKMINLPIGSSGEKASLQSFQQLLAEQLHTGIYNKAGKVVVADAGNVRAMELIIAMIKAGIGADIPSFTPAEFAMWGNGTVATVINASWLKGIIEGLVPGTAGKWGIMELPAFNPGGTRVSSAGGSGMVIPKATSNMEAAWAFIQFALLRVGPQVQEYKTGAPIPSLMSTYRDPVFKQPSKFWGGQEVGTLYAKLEPQVPAYYYAPHYREVIQSLLPIGVWNAATGKQSPRTALQGVAKTVEAQFSS